MLCVSIIDYGYENCLKSLKKCDRLSRELGPICVELRLELCGLNTTEVEQLCCQTRLPVIVTCGRKTMDQVEGAVRMGASYVDIDAVCSNTVYHQLLAVTERKKKVKKILSYYNYHTTPPMSELKKIYRHAVKRGAAIVKIVTTARRNEDVERILELYGEIRNAEEFPESRPLIAYCMGGRGAYSRVESYRLGAPFIYCVLNSKSIFATGQFTVEQLRKMKMPTSLSGKIDVPASKSIAQRAIIAAAMAQGESEFYNFTPCKDIDTTIAVARQLGATVHVEGDTLHVRGNSLHLKKKKIEENLPFSPDLFMSNSIGLFVGESGLLSRLCIPIAAQMGEEVMISGEGALLARKMYGCKDALEQYDADCILTAEDTLPAVVSGPLAGGEVTISGKKGSQLISGLIMALPIGKKDSILKIENPTSLFYMQMTLDVIARFGIEVSAQVKDGHLVMKIPGKQKYRPVEMALEGDWSIAANFIIASFLFGPLTLKGLNLSSTQPHKMILGLIERCGAHLVCQGDEIQIYVSHIRPFEYDITQTPKLLPIIAVLALYCQGDSVITGIERLRNSEGNISDGIVQELTRMGGELELDGDTLYIHGSCLTKRIIDGKLLKGGNYSSHQDHRLAMALTIAALGCKDKVTISGMDAVSKSFPRFEEIMSSLKIKQ